MELQPISGKLKLRVEKDRPPTEERERGNDDRERHLSLESIASGGVCHDRHEVSPCDELTTMLTRQDRETVH